MPGKTRFKSPAQSQDLLVEWKQMKVNVDLPTQNFTIQVPAGLGLRPEAGAEVLELDAVAREVCRVASLATVPFGASYQPGSPCR